MSIYIAHRRRKTSKALNLLCGMAMPKGVFIATQLNANQLDVESTGSLRSLIGDSCSRCERVDKAELCRYRHFANSTQLDSTRRRAELCRYKHPLTDSKL